jgi:hypothetical protein
MHPHKSSLLVLLITAVSACAPRAIDTLTAPASSGRDVLAQMQRMYDHKWYQTLTFVQRTTITRADGTQQVSTWYEALQSPDRLRIDFDDPKAGNGVLYTADSVYVVRGGRSRRRSVSSLRTTSISPGFEPIAGATAPCTSWALAILRIFRRRSFGSIASDRLRCASSFHWEAAPTQSRTTYIWTAMCRWARDGWQRRSRSCRRAWLAKSKSTATGARTFHLLRIYSWRSAGRPHNTGRGKRAAVTECITLASPCAIAHSCPLLPSPSRSTHARASAPLPRQLRSRSSASR